MSERMSERHLLGEKVTEWVKDTWEEIVDRMNERKILTWKVGNNDTMTSCSQILDEVSVILMRSRSTMETYHNGWFSCDFFPTGILTVKCICILYLGQDSFSRNILVQWSGFRPFLIQFTTDSNFNRSNWILYHWILNHDTSHCFRSSFCSSVSILELRKFLLFPRRPTRGNNVEWNDDGWRRMIWLEGKSGKGKVMVRKSCVERQRKGCCNKTHTRRKKVNRTSG